MQGAGASTGFMLIAGVLAALSPARAAHPSPRGPSADTTSATEQLHERDRYRQSIRNATDEQVLTQLAVSFEMAGYADLAAEARTKAAALRQERASVPPPASPQPDPVTGPRVLLVPRTNYRARLSLGFFQCLGSRNKITEKFNDLGFSDVRVFMGQNELPTDWPASFRQSSGRCARFVEGTWNGPTRVLERPKAVDLLWIRDFPSATATEGGPGGGSS
jgi:hypothetical protein